MNAEDFKNFQECQKTIVNQHKWIAEVNYGSFPWMVSAISDLHDAAIAAIDAATTVEQIAEARQQFYVGIQGIPSLPES